MKRQIDHKSHSFAPALRRLMTVFLTVAYVVVGLAGEICCAKETLAGVDQIEVSDTPSKSDQGSKKSVVVVDHCYTCAPLVVPAPVLLAEPTVRLLPPTFATPTFLLEDYPGLDTPPPKYLT